MSTHITHDEWKALQSQFSDALKEIELSKSLLLESNKENENLRTAREDNWRKCEQLKAEINDWKLAAVTAREYEAVLESELTELVELKDKEIAKLRAELDEYREMKPLLEAFPEINLANYGDDEVRALNQWGIDVVLFTHQRRNEMSEPIAIAFKDAAGRDCLSWSQNEALEHGQDGTMRPLYEHAETEEAIVLKLNAMAVESLPPEIFKKWHEVFKTLCETRKNLNPGILFDAGCFTAVSLER